MSVSIYSRSHDEEFERVRYNAAHMYYYGADDQYGMAMPATVWVDFTGGALGMSVEDAQTLMEHLAVVLVEHAVASKDSPTGPKAVA